MPNQIFPLNVDPESPLEQISKKKKKPTFKQWFNERKRMLGIVLGVCLVTVGAIIYPYLDLQLGKGSVYEKLDEMNIPSTPPTIEIDNIKINPEKEGVAGEVTTFEIEASGLENNSYNIAIYFGDGEYDYNDMDGGSPYKTEHIYAKPGPYNVTVKASGTGGEYEVSKKILYEVTAPTIKIDINTDPQRGVVGRDSTFTIEASGLEDNSYNIYIDFGDGGSDHNDMNGGSPYTTEHTYNEPGIYPVVVTASSDNTDNGVIKEVTETINYEVNLPTIEIDNIKINPEKEGVAGEATTFEIEASGLEDNSYNIYIDFGDGGSDHNDMNGGSPYTTEHVYAEPGTYEVEVKASGRDGIKEVTKTITYEVSNADQSTDPTEDIPTNEITVIEETPKLTLSSSPNANRQPVNTAVTYTLAAKEDGVFTDSNICFIDFGDETEIVERICGTTSSITFPVHTYAKTGPFTAKAGTKANSASTTNTNEVTSPLSYIIYDVLTSSLDLSVSDTSPKIEDEDDGVEVKFRLTAENLTAPYTYEIDYGYDDDKNSVKKQTSETYDFDYTYYKEGSYNILATVIDAKGTTKTASYTLKVTLADDAKDSDDDDEDEDEEDCTNKKDDDGDSKIDYEDSEDCPIPSSQAITISGVYITKSKFDPNVNTPKIIYKLNRDAKVTIEILDSSEKTVVKLLDNVLQRSKNVSGLPMDQAVWFNGTVDNKEGSQTLANGTYTYKISAVNPTYETISATPKQGVVVIDTQDTAGDLEGTGTSIVKTTATTSTTSKSTTTPLSTTTSKTSNLAALTMQNTPPTSTSGTGPETLIYLIFPAISAFALTRKNK